MLKVALDSDIKAALDRVGEGCDKRKYYNQHRLRYEQLLSRLRAYVPSGRLLDVGAAPGHVLMTLAQVGYDAHGLVYSLKEDWEGTEAESLQFSARWGDFPLTLAECDIQNEPFPYPDDYFDAVIFTEVLEHLWMFPGAIISEIFRVTKNGGYIFLTTPNATHIVARTKWLCGSTSFTNLDTMISLPIHMRHNREYTRKEVNTLLRMYGFHIIKSIYEEPYARSTKFKGEHAFEDRFLLNSPHQIVKAALLLVKSVVPAFRSGLTVIAQKKRESVG